MEHLTIGNDLFPIGDKLNTEEIEIQINAVHPKALIPPYNIKDEIYTARCAEWTRLHFPNVKTGIVVPAVIRSRAVQLIRLFQKTGYEPIIFHQEFPLIPWLPSLKKHLNENQWYHACGIDLLIFHGIPGHWTRGDML